MKTLLITITLVYIAATALLLNRTLTQQRDKLIKISEECVDFNTRLINEKLREDSIFLKPSRITPHTPILD